MFLRLNSVFNLALKVTEGQEPLPSITTPSFPPDYPPKQNLKTQDSLVRALVGLSQEHRFLLQVLGQYLLHFLVNYRPSHFPRSILELSFLSPIDFVR